MVFVISSPYDPRAHGHGLPRRSPLATYSTGQEVYSHTRKGGLIVKSLAFGSSPSWRLGGAAPGPAKGRPRRSADGCGWERAQWNSGAFTALGPVPAATVFECTGDNR